MASASRELHFLVESHLQVIYEEKDYPQLNHDAFASRLINTMGLLDLCLMPSVHHSPWDQRNNILITYGDSIRQEGEYPLATFKRFFDQRLSNTFSGVHILPFFPYSSDDGFSVINYTQVNDSLGGWEHIEAIASSAQLMADLVINHCSARGQWFENFKQRKDPGKDYFYTVDPDTDITRVVRPRTSPLLQEVETLDGKKYVWSTFSHDQVDLDFANPEVLLEIIHIIKIYLDRGVRIFRLDAVAYIWKEPGTTCINHPKAHEIVRLIRTLIEHFSPSALIITETNVPNHENLSYFGNANEAHAVYNFSLPPLLLNALITGSCRHLKTWQLSMPPAQEGTFYFNFIASHDGIGLRPAEGLLDDDEIDTLINTMTRFGGRISWRTAPGGHQSAYEINITLFDALKGTRKGRDQWQVARFLCAHAVMLALEGIPGFYIHSLFATHNYDEGVELSGQNRTINRYKWDYQTLTENLDGDTHHARVFSALSELIRIRGHHKAFHPNAPQFTLHLVDEVFGFWRQSLDRDQNIFCLHNISDQVVAIPLSAINLTSSGDWADLVSGQTYGDFHQDLVLSPYQFVWLTDKPSATASTD